MKMASSSANPLITPSPSSVRQNKPDGGGSVLRCALCYGGYVCCAVLGLSMIALVIFNTVTTLRLRDELREIRDQLDMDNDDILMINDWVNTILAEEDSEDDLFDETEAPSRRSARSLDRTAHGIPVNDESYAVSRQRTNSPADDIIDDLLLRKPATVRPTMVYDWNRRQKRFHAASSEHHHPNDVVPDDSRPPPRTDSGHVQTRAGSRAMSTITSDRSKAFRQVMTKSEYEQWQAQRAHPGRGAMLTRSLETRHDARAPPMLAHRVRTIIAVHYGAVRQRDAGAPAHVRNIDWQPSKWVNKLAMDRFFQMDDGVVRVRKSGLYQVYAQITFEKRSSANGFIVVHNAERFLECQTSTQSSNSCYTSRVVYMESDDQIRLSDMFANQRVVLHEGQSFFGLMKLGQVQDRTGGNQQQ